MICSKCNQTKSHDQFPKSKTCKSGYRSYCRICKNKQTASYYYANKTKHREKADKWVKENPQKVKEIKANWKKITHYL